MLSKVRLSLSGGGTGGHVYPALAVVEEWKTATGPDPAAAGGLRPATDLPQLEDVLYIGTVGGLEASIVPRAGLPFRAVEGGALRGLGPLRAAANALSLLRGTVQAIGILRRFRPDVLLATGGYASTPVAVAAWCLRCPVLVYLPDIQPGLAVRFLSHLARRVAVSFEEARSHFPPGKVVLTGYPVRPALYSALAGRQGACLRLGLDPRLKMVLVLGGSRGARSINVAVNEGLEGLLAVAQVVHMTGENDITSAQERCAALPAEFRGRYHPYAYLHEEMVPALLAADLAVARAGAATLGEFAAAGLPSILVPYPYSGQHQAANAEFMAARGAARHVADSALTGPALLQAVQALLKDEATLRTMSQSARGLARRHAAHDIARELALLAGGER